MLVAKQRQDSVTYKCEFYPEDMKYPKDLNIYIFQENKAKE